jgi:purine nucleoside permease
MNLIQRAAVATLLASVTFLSAKLGAEERIPVKVVVVTAFDKELQNWITELPLPVTIPFPQGFEALHYNPNLQVLGLITWNRKSTRRGLDYGSGP